MESLNKDQEEPNKKNDEVNTSYIYLKFNNRNTCENIRRKGIISYHLALSMINEENKYIEKIELGKKVCLSEKMEIDIKFSQEEIGKIKK